MRRIFVFNRVTVDGYFAGLDGNLDWVVPEAELDKEAVESIGQYDTVLFGRRTYEMFESFWPQAVTESSTSPNPHYAGQISPEMRAMGVFLNEANKLVFSKSLKEARWKNSHILEFDADKIRALKEGPGKDMIMFGSGSIVTLLTQHRLIDEYGLIVSPVILGAGKPMISGAAARLKLDLQEAKQYPSGNVMLRYTPSKRD